MTEVDEDWFRTGERHGGMLFDLFDNWGAIIVLNALAAVFLAIIFERAFPPPPKPIGTITMPASTSTIAESFAPAAPKTDKIVDRPADDSIKIVRTVAVAPLFRPLAVDPKFEPFDQPVVAQTEFPSLPKPQVAKPPERDVCARHGGHREESPGKRGGWHCVYSKKS